MAVDTDPLSSTYGQPLRQAASEDDFWAARVDRQAEDEKTTHRMASIATADANPDARARVINLARYLQVPETEVETEVSRAKAAADAAGVRWSDLPAYSRRLAMDERTAPIVRDDLDNQTGLSRHIAMLRFGYEQGANSFRGSLLREKASRGPLTPQEQSEYNALQTKAREVSGIDDAANSWTRNAAQVGASVVGLFANAFTPEGIAKTMTGATAGALYAAAAGQAGPQVFVPEEVLTIPAGIIGGALAGWSAQMYEVNARAQKGEALQGLDALEEREGKKLNPRVKDLAATYHGLIGGALDSVSLGIAAGPLRRMFMHAVTQALVRPTVQQAAIRWGKHYAEVVASETVTETIQEASQILFTNAAIAVSKVSTGEWKGLSNTEVADRLASTVVQTAQAMIVLGPFGGAVPFAFDTANARAATQRMTQFRALADWVNASKLKDRLPDEFRAGVDESGADAGVENVYISSQAFTTYFQSKNMDPEQVASELGVLEQLKEAGTDDRDLVIPLGTFTERVVPTEHYAELAKDARFDPLDMSAREASDTSAPTISDMFTQAREAIAAREEVNKNLDESAAKVHALMVEKLVAAGSTPEIANVQASVEAAAMRALGSRLGIDPLSLHLNRPVRLENHAFGSTVPGIGLTMTQPGEHRPVTGELIKNASPEGVNAASRNVYPSEYEQGQWNQDEENVWKIPHGLGPHLIDEGAHDANSALKIVEVMTDTEIEDAKDHAREDFSPGDESINADHWRSIIYELNQRADVLVHLVTKIFRSRAREGTLSNFATGSVGDWIDSKLIDAVTGLAIWGATGSKGKTIADAIDAFSVAATTDHSANAKTPSQRKDEINRRSDAIESLLRMLDYENKIAGVGQSEKQSEFEWGDWTSPDGTLRQLIAKIPHNVGNHMVDAGITNFNQARDDVLSGIEEMITNLVESASNSESDAETMELIQDDLNERADVAAYLVETAFEQRPVASAPFFAKPVTSIDDVLTTYAREFTYRHETIGEAVEWMLKRLRDGSIPPPSGRSEELNPYDKMLASAFERGAIASALFEILDADKHVSAEVSPVFETGKPVTVRGYHGSGATRIAEEGFSKKKLGSNTNAKSATLGFFFSGGTSTPNSYLPHRNVSEHPSTFDTADGKAIVKWAVQNPDEFIKLMDATKGFFPSTIGHLESIAKEYKNVTALMLESTTPSATVVAAYKERKRRWKHAVTANLMGEPLQSVSDLGYQILGHVPSFENDVRPVIYPARLHMQNPLVHDFKGSHYREETYASLLEKALKAGHDSAIFLNTFDGGPKDNIFIVFSPDQIEMTLYQSLSTRVPTAQKDAEDHRGEVLVTNLNSATRHMRSFEKNVDLVTGYGNYRPSARAVTPLQRANRFIDHVVSNLLWLHDNTDPEVRNRAKLWYDGARKLAERWAEKYGITDMQAAAVLAVLSPQKDWYQNVSLAERVLDVMAQGMGPWTPEMDAWLASKPQLQNNVIGEMRQELIDKDVGNRPEPSLAAIALYVRAYDEVHNPRHHRILTPEGDFVEFATNADGSRSKVGWGGFGTIAKAVSIIRNGDAENISNALGAQHKVRNFYNNIFHPNSALPFVTMDTHAIAAGLLRPLSGNSDEVTQNFGGKGSSSAATTGSQGTYSLFAEAYIRAAAQRGLLPREMQSITWEAVRALFPAEWKTDENNATVAAIWDRYRAGRLSLENTRSEIVAAVGRFGRPEWGVGPDSSDAAQAPDSSYRDQLAASVVPGGMDRGRGDGGGRGASSAGGGVPPNLTLQQEARGEITFGTNEDIIRLFAAQDLSTFLHESGHRYLNMLFRINHPALEADKQAILDYLKVGSFAEIGRDQHEVFARSFEAYLREGKAPSEGLRAAFRSFRDWLVQIYRTAAGLKVTLTPEIRGVFDRLLATDDEIAAQEQALSIVPVLDALGSIGATAAETARYHEMSERAASEAREKLLAKSLAQLTKQASKEYRDRRKELEAVAREQVRALPVYQAGHYFRTGKLLVGALPEGTARIRLAKDAIQSIYNSVYDSSLKSQRIEDRFPGMYALEGGVHPDSVAFLFGYDSGEEMLTDIETAPSMDEAVDQIVEPQLREEFGDMLTDGTLEAEAQAALQTSEAQIALLAEEVRILRRLGGDKLVKAVGARGVRQEGPRDAQAMAADAKAAKEAVPDAAAAAGAEGARGAVVLAEAAKGAQTEGVGQREAVAAGEAQTEAATAEPSANSRFTRDELNAMRGTAEDVVAGRKVRHAASVAQFQAEEARAFRKLKRAIAGRHYAEAAQAARQRLFARLLTAVGVKAKDEIAKDLKYLKRLDDMVDGKTIDLEYLEQIHDLLQRFDLRKVSGPQAAKRKSLQMFLVSQAENGQETAVPQSLVDEAFRKPYQDMTLEEFRGLVDAVKNIEHLGRFKRKLLDRKRQREFAEVKDAILAQIYAKNKLRPESPNMSPDLKEEIVGVVENLHAKHTKLEFLFQALDGDEPLGPVWDAFFRPFVDAEAEEQARAATLQAQLNTIFDRVPKAERGRWFTDRVHTIGRKKLTHAELLSVALNWGNEGNRTAILAGHGWTEGGVELALEAIPDEQWVMVQDIWDLIDTLWPDTVELYRDVAGVQPEKVEAMPFVTRSGKRMKGGYYPLAYDPKKAVRAKQNEEKRETKDLLQVNFMRAMTRDGHTKTRLDAEKHKLPVLLDLGVIGRHLNDVTHDLTHRRALLDADRLSQDRDVQAAIVNTKGMEAYLLIRPWLQAIAAGTPGPANSIEKILARARAGTTIVNMGWKVSTAIVQPLGITQTINAIGLKHTWEGLSRFYNLDMGQNIEFIMSRSPQMRSRMTNFDRDVRDTKKMMAKSAHSAVAETFFALTAYGDMSVSMPTWLGAYSQGMADFKDEERAISYADMIVRTTQSAGSIKDLAEVQRGGEGMKLFTAFYSYFNLLYNLFAKAQRTLVRERDVPQFLASMMWIWFIPAVVSEMIALRAPDDDDDWAAWALKKELMYPFQSAVILRDIVNAIGTNFDYQLTPVQEAFGLIADNVKNAGELAQEGDTFTKSESKAAVNAVGYWAHLPTKQMWITGDAFYRWLVNDEDVPPEDFLLSPQRKAKQ